VLEVKEMKFEQALSRLEEIVENLERGELSLEVSLKKFEEGIGLSRFCAKKLDEAQEKVELLLAEEDGAKKTQSFPVPEQGGDEVEDEE
jgi:exodeoxyribonuclease VII small subunit